MAERISGDNGSKTREAADKVTDRKRMDNDGNRGPLQQEATPAPAAENSAKPQQRAKVEPSERVAELLKPDMDKVRQDMGKMNEKFGAFFTALTEIRAEIAKETPKAQPTQPPQQPQPQQSNIREADDRERTDSDDMGYYSPAEQDVIPDAENFEKVFQALSSLCDKQSTTEKQIREWGDKWKENDKRADAHHEEFYQLAATWTKDMGKLAETWKQDMDKARQELRQEIRQEIGKVNEKLATVFNALNLPAQAREQTTQQQQQQQQQGSDKYLLKMNDLAKENFVLRVEREYDKLGIKDSRVDTAWNERWNHLKLESNSFVQASSTDVTAVFDRTCKDLFADVRNLSQAFGMFASRRPTDVISAITWAEYLSRFASTSSKNQSAPPQKENRAPEIPASPSSLPPPSSSSSSTPPSSRSSSSLTPPPSTSPSSTPPSSTPPSLTRSSSSLTPPSPSPTPPSSTPPSATPPSSTSPSLTPSSLSSSSLTSSVRQPNNNAMTSASLTYKAVSPPQFTTYYDLDEREVTGLAEFAKNLPGPLKKISDGVVIEKPCAVITFIAVHNRIDVTRWKPLWKERQQRSDNRHVLVLVYDDSNAAPSSSQYSGWIPEFVSIVTMTPFTVIFDTSGMGKPPKQQFLPKESSPCFFSIASFLRPFPTAVGIQPQR